METVEYVFGKRAVESNLGRVMKWAKSGSVTISACRGDKTTKENLKRTEDLILDLKELGYGYIPLFGQYVEEENGLVTEYSFLVPYPNKNREESFEDMISALQVLGDKYDQECILVVKDNLGTLLYSDGKQIEAGEFTFPVNKSEYTSALAKGNHRNRKWSMEGVVGFPRTMNGRMGASRLGELE